MIRRLYAEGLERIVESPLEPKGERDLTVYTFSGEAHVPEQVASLRSLIRHLGKPRRIVVISDGTHTPSSSRLIERIGPAISVVDYRDMIRPDVPGAIKPFIERSGMGMKLAIEWSMEIEGPTMYSDADVLFFPRIAELPEGLARDGRPRYLQDFDSRFLDPRLVGGGEREPPTNAGLQLLFHRLDWGPALERFEAAVDPRSLVSGGWEVEQAVVHLAMRATGGAPLPRDRYVLEVDDEHDWRDRYGGSHIALRHYCFSNAVQRKLWLNVWDDIADVVRSSPRFAARAGFRAALKWRKDRRQARAPEQGAKPQH